ncbi:MAG: hypothetical protein SPI09_01390 [Candidatus Limivicinus sp.]|nr:hypothetical protein [Clostridiales bacterium]MDY6132006.1 hypothetical protein [Candidatus Limivicinus sp.]
MQLRQRQGESPLIAAQMTITASEKVIGKAICKCKAELEHSSASLWDSITLALCGIEVKYFLHLNRK